MLRNFHKATVDFPRRRLTFYFNYWIRHKNVQKRENYSKREKKHRERGKKGTHFLSITTFIVKVILYFKCETLLSTYFIYFIHFMCLIK